MLVVLLATEALFFRHSEYKLRETDLETISRSGLRTALRQRGGTHVSVRTRPLETWIPHVCAPQAQRCSLSCPSLVPPSLNAPKCWPTHAQTPEDTYSKQKKKHYLKTFRHSLSCRCYAGSRPCTFDTSSLHTVLAAMLQTSYDRLRALTFYRGEFYRGFSP